MDNMLFCEWNVVSSFLGTTNRWNHSELEEVVTGPDKSHLPGGPIFPQLWNHDIWKTMIYETIM